MILRSCGDCALEEAGDWAAEVVLGCSDAGADGDWGEACRGMANKPASRARLRWNVSLATASPSREESVIVERSIAESRLVADGEAG